MINASSLLSSLEGRKGRLEILKAAVEATPLSGHEDEAAALLSAIGDNRLIKERAKENPPFFSKLAPYFYQHGIDFRNLADFYLDTENADLGKTYECGEAAYPKNWSYRMAFLKFQRNSFAFLLLDSS